MKKSQPSVPKVSVPAGSPSGYKLPFPAVFGVASILRAVRTAHAKAVRRIYGDRGGALPLLRPLFFSLLPMVALTPLPAFRKITSY